MTPTIIENAIEVKDLFKEKDKYLLTPELEIIKTQLQLFEKEHGFFILWVEELQDAMMPVEIEDYLTEEQEKEFKKYLSKIL